MLWSFLAVVIVVALGLAVLPIVLMVLGVRFVWRRALGRGGRDGGTPPSIEGQHAASLPASPSSRRGCPAKERSTLRDMERRLETARQRSLEALDRRFSSELARGRVSMPLEDAYAQIRDEIASIYAFCERNDLAGTLKKARQSSSAQDIYRKAYERDLAKVDVAIEKTEECLAALERTVATLEVSSVEADLDSDFDASIEMLRDLRQELPLYNLEDRV